MHKCSIVVWWVTSGTGFTRPCIKGQRKQHWPVNKHLKWGTVDNHPVPWLSGLGNAVEEKGTYNKIEWQEEWRKERNGPTRGQQTYHDGVFREALPHILHKFHKVFRVAIGHVQAYILHLGNSVQDLFQLLKVRRACAWAGSQMLWEKRPWACQRQQHGWLAKGSGEVRVGRQAKGIVGRRLRQGSGGPVLPQDSQDSGWQTLSTARGCSVYGQQWRGRTGEKKALKRKELVRTAFSGNRPLYYPIWGTKGLKSGKSNLKMSVVELRPQFHHYSPYKCNRAFPHKPVPAQHSHQSTKSFGLDFTCQRVQCFWLKRWQGQAVGAVG